MTQKSLDDLSGIGKAIITWCGILGLLATIVLNWDQINRNAESIGQQQIQIQQNTDHVTRSEVKLETIEKDVAEVKGDVKSLLIRGNKP